MATTTIDKTILSEVPFNSYFVPPGTIKEERTTIYVSSSAVADYTNLNDALTYAHSKSSITGYLYIIVVGSGTYFISNLKLGTKSTASLFICSDANNCLIAFKESGLAIGNTNLTFSKVYLNFWDTMCNQCGITLTNNSSMEVSDCTVSYVYNGFKKTLTVIQTGVCPAYQSLRASFINCVFNVYFTGRAASFYSHCVLDFSSAASFSLCMDNVHIYIKDIYDKATNFTFIKLQNTNTGMAYFEVLNSFITWDVFGSSAKTRFFIKTNVKDSILQTPHQLRNIDFFVTGTLAQALTMTVCSYSTTAHTGQLYSSRNHFTNTSGGVCVGFDIGVGDTVSSVGDASVGAVTSHTGDGSYVVIGEGAGHTFLNQDLLDTYNQTNADLTTAVLWKHYHYVFHDKDVQNTYAYYGFSFLNYWKITRKTIASGIWGNATGTGDYATNWADRENKAYA